MPQEMMGPSCEHLKIRKFATKLCVKGDTVCKAFFGVSGAGASEMFVASAHHFHDGLPISDFNMKILLLTKDFFFLADRGC